MKAKRIPGMILDPERAKLLMEMTDEEAGKVIKALVAYAHTQALPEFSGVLLLCFKTLLDGIEQAWEKKRNRSEQNRRSARIRWTDANACERMQTDANACERIPDETKNPLDLLLTGEDGEPIVVFKHG